MTIKVGTLLGHYQVINQLGAGGMGEVYRAKDTRLDREVAIKVLPADFANDADRLKRFEQEARATSALNHPNILTVHDIGFHDGAPFIVAELLEGEELREQLVDNSPVLVKRAIDYAQQVAAGLAAAHEKGIVHRDLKPENLFVTKDGRVKILDFGLAKLRTPRSRSGSSEIATQKQVTEPGTVMGTVGYMSPEQVRAGDVDHRSDIFSFGVILYEMLSGNRPFTGDSAVELMNAILKEEPSELSEANAKIFPALDRIVRRCLEKKPERRFQSASDLRFALETLAPLNPSGSVSRDATPIAKPAGWRAHLWEMAATLLALLFLATATLYFIRSSDEPGPLRLTFTPPGNVTFSNEPYDYVVISPDGQKVVFLGNSADGKKQLWVRAIDGNDATPLPGTEEALSPFWSPDSRSIAFGSQGKLKRTELVGGRPQTICDAARLEGGTWNKAGTILFAPTRSGGLFRVSAVGGNPSQVTSVDSSREYAHIYPCFLKDGSHFIFKTVGLNRAQWLVAGSLESKQTKQLITDAAPAVYSSAGWLLFVRNGALVAQQFDSDRLEIRGDPISLTQPTNVPYVLSCPISVSDNGVLIWRGDGLRNYQLVWVDREGKETGSSGTPVRTASGQTPSLSPDGKRLAFSLFDPQTRDDIWFVDVARNIPTRLTSFPGGESSPQWSPDGKRLAFNAQVSNIPGIYEMSANGLEGQSLLVKGQHIPLCWSVDGRFILYNVISEKTRRDVWALPLFGGREPYPILESGFDELEAQLSPDGRWLAYACDETGNMEIYIQPFSADGNLGGTKQRISTNGGKAPRFRGDGRELFFVDAVGQMTAVTLKAEGTSISVEPPKVLFKTRMLSGMFQVSTDYDVMADGQHFVIGTLVGEAPPVSVIVNWTAGLKH